MVARAGKVYWCDAARAVGIVLVVLGHTLGLSAPLELWIYSFHMPLFFFLSGFVLTDSRLKQALQVNIVHYSNRLLVPYAAFSLLTYVPWVLLTRHLGADAALNISPFRPLLGTLYGVGVDGWLQHNAMLWFLPCLFVVHLVYQLLLSRLDWVRQAMGTVALPILGIELARLLPFRLPWGAEVALIGMPFYAVGHAMAGLEIERLKKTYAALLLLLTAGMQFICIYTNGRVDMNFISLGNPVLFYVGAFAGIGGLVFAVQFIPESQIIKKIADASMLIFVTHRTLYSVLTAILMMFITDIQGLKASGLGSVVYSTWAVLIGVLTVPYFKRFAPILMGGRQ